MTATQIIVVLIMAIGTFFLVVRPAVTKNKDRSFSEMDKELFIIMMIGEFVLLSVGIGLIILECL